MTIKPTVLFILSAVLLCHSLPAQRLRFTQLDIQQGLPAQEVYNLLQDDRGYIWAFTEHGMARHNGVRFVPVSLNLPFAESIVYTVRRSPSGEIYFANSRAHIYRLRNDSAFLVKGMDSLAEKLFRGNESVYDMQVNGPRDIYFSTYRNSYHLLGHKIIPLTSQVFGDTGRITLKQAGTGYVALHESKSRKNFFIRISGKKDQILFEGAFPFILEMGDRCRLVENERYYFIQSNEKLIRINKNGKDTRVAAVSDLMNLKMSPQGQLWVGTKKGLYLLDTALNLLGSYFENCVVSDILFDNKAGAWVSTIEQGVFYCRNTRHFFYDNVPDLSGSITMLKKSANGLFIGTANGKLMYLSPAGNRQIDTGPNPTCINDVFEHRGQYLVGTKNSIRTLDHNLDLVHTRFYKTPDNNYISSYGFAPYSNDTVILITSGSLNWISPRNGTNKPEAIQMGTTNKTIIEHGQVFLIGTTRGLAIVKNFSDPPGFFAPLKDISIIKLRNDHLGNTWICTKGYGLFVLYTNGSFKKIRPCPSSIVNDITFEKNGILLSTNKGLYWHAFAGKAGSSSWHRIIGTSVTGCVSYGDTVFVATRQGLISLSKQNLHVQFNPPFFLRSVSSGKRTIAPQNIQLAHDENSPVFNFELLSYDNPDCSLRFKLAGPGHTQNFTGPGRLHLQNLGPGNYTLYAYAIDNSHNKSLNSPVITQFYIQPAFWQTPVFFVLVWFSVTALILFIMWLGYRRLRKKEQRKTMIVRELAENRLTALKSQINPHFISNSLTAIQHLVLSNEIDRANLYIARFSMLIRHTLDYSDKTLTSLANELSIIEIVISLEQLRFNSDFSFEYDIDPGIDPHKVFIPPLITQPIIENAIWHGLLPLKGLREPRLILRIRQNHQSLILSIIDNGVGRFSAKQSIPGKESKGNKLISSWIENLNKLFPVNGASLYVTDLHDEQHRSNGTRVDIVLNIQALHHLQHDKRYSPTDQKYYY